MKKKGVSLTTRKQRAGYWFVMPFLIGFTIFFLSPLIFYIVMGFSDMSLTNEGLEFTYTGLKNFKEVFLNEPRYIVNVLNSLQPLLLNLFAIVMFSLFVALLLNQKFIGRAFARAVFFLPVIVASGAVAVNSTGDKLLNNAQAVLTSGNASVKMNVDITQNIIELFGSNDVTHNLVSVVSTIVSGMFDITQASGIQILIFLAGLQAISPSLYEASKMDGATGWENFWKITLPMISPMILVNVVYTIVDQLSSVNNSTVSQMYELAVEELKYTNSAAMGIMYFAIVIAVLVVAMAILSKFVYYDERTVGRGGKC